MGGDSETSCALPWGGGGASCWRLRVLSLEEGERDIQRGGFSLNRSIARTFNF